MLANHLSYLLKMMQAPNCLGEDHLAPISNYLGKSSKDTGQDSRGDRPTLLLIYENKQVAHLDLEVVA